MRFGIISLKIYGDIQWTKIETPLTPEIKQVLYNESQGIIDIAVKFYQLAQWRVIGEADEKITPGLIRQVAHDSLQLARPILEALKNRDRDKLKEIEDVRPPIEKLDEFYKQAHERVTTYGILNTLRNNQIGGGKTVLTDEHAPIYQITRWLTDAGFELKHARTCAEAAFKKYQEEIDLTKAMQAAFQIALETQNDPPTQPTIKSKKKSRTKIIMFPDDLRSLTGKAANEGISGYDALKKAGYIKPIKEFL